VSRPAAAAQGPVAEFRVPTGAAMRALGRRLAGLLRPGDLVVLNGPLGAGKTTLVQGIGAGLDVRGPVTSPTFVIARVHPALGTGPALVHADAYRLSTPAEVDDLDLDADLENSVTVVEWGGGLVEGLAPSWLDITIVMPEPDGEPESGFDPGGALDADREPDPGGGLDPGGEPDPGGGLDPGGELEADSEPRIVRLAGRGERWAAAAGSVHLVLSGAAQVL
jgi:tRNA threonylcarbamoyl adenosine modification protein YjeE